MPHNISVKPRVTQPALATATTAPPALRPPRHAEPQVVLVPLSLDDLRRVESTLYQSGGRFTTQQRLFFEFLLASPDLDEREAARQANVSLVKARRWLARPDVIKTINHLMQARLQRAGIDKDALLTRMVACLDMAMGSVPVRKAAYDPALGGFYSAEVLETNLSAAGRFTEQLAKHLRLFSDEDDGRPVVHIHMDMGTLAPETAPAPAPLHTGETFDHDSGLPEA